MNTMGKWDHTAKQLFYKYPQDYARWLAQADFVLELNPNLPSQALDADGLLQAKRNGQDILIHLEFQRRIERSKMPRRMWKYNALADMKYELPVASFVIYLKREGNIAIS